MAYKNERLASGDIATFLRRLYECEINVAIECTWDGGWNIWLGGLLNSKWLCTIDNAYIWQAGQALARKTYVRVTTVRKPYKSGFHVGTPAIVRRATMSFVPTPPGKATAASGRPSLIIC